MAKARVTTSHTYNEGEAGEIVKKIFEEYSILLKLLNIRLTQEKSNIENSNQPK